MYYFTFVFPFSIFVESNSSPLNGVQYYFAPVMKRQKENQEDDIISGMQLDGKKIS